MHRLKRSLLRLNWFLLIFQFDVWLVGEDLVDHLFPSHVHGDTDASQDLLGLPVLARSGLLLARLALGCGVLVFLSTDFSYETGPVYSESVT